MTLRPGLIFETPRLRARQLEVSDVEALHAVYGDAQTMRWVDDGTPLSFAQCQRWIEVSHHNYTTRGYGMFALLERRSGDVIGFCGLVLPGGQTEVEIKYALQRRFWGQGLATEAAAALLRYDATELGIHHMIATTAPKNIPSHRVLCKVGMCRGELRPEADGSFTQLFRWHSRE